MSHRRLVILAIAVLSAAAPAWAQAPTAAPDPDKVRVHLGPLLMNPSIALTNLGVDNNVFNEPDDAPPKRDFTFTVTPLTDMWLRLGRTWIKGTVKEDLVWYQTYASERSGNTNYMLAWQVPLNRLSFSISNAWLRTRDRPGFEIDARSLRTEMTSVASVEIRALSKTFLGVRGQRNTTNFDRAAVFLGNSLQDELNRVVTSGGLTLRHELTPLTSITLVGSRSQDRFEFSPLRDANSTSFTGTVVLDPAALIKGSASFGYRDFKPVAGDLPGYSGTTADVGISYTLFGTTKLALGILRDVQYSFDVNQPYYLLTSFDASIAQQVFGPFDVVARGGRQHLGYSDRLGAAVAVADRVDIVRSVGGGIGYHMGRDVRIGFNIDQQRRSSAVAGHQYHGLRIGTAVTYGS